MQREIVTEHSADWISEKKASLGVKFFFIYLIFYGGFVAIGVLNFELLAIGVFHGINLAVFYGFGLIVLAILLGLWYNSLCNRYEQTKDEEVSK